MRRAALALAAAAALLPAAPACSQVPHLPVFSERMRSLSLSLGLASPTDTNTFSQAVRGGPMLSIQYQRYLWDWVSWGAELGYFKLGKKTRHFELGGAGADLTREASAIALLVLARINILRERSWTPYLVGGAGLNQFDFKASVKSTPPGAVLICPSGDISSCTGGAVGAKSTGISVSGGAGVEAFLVRNLSLAGEFRYYEFRVDKKKFGADAAEALGYTVGLRYWFGK